MNNEFIEKPYVPIGFKYWKQGWYDESSVNKPMDAIKVPQDEYEAIMDGQSKGLQIVENTSGYPVLIGTLPTPEDLAKQREQIALQQQIQKIQMRLTELSKDMAQEQAGEIVPNIVERKAEFVRIHNELRVLENKQPRALSDKINALENNAKVGV